MNEHPGCGCPFCGGSHEPGIPHPVPRSKQTYDLTEPGRVEALQAEVNRLASLLERNEGRIKQIVDEKLLRERDQYKSLARELAGAADSLRRMLHGLTHAPWPLEECERAACMKTNALLSRPEVNALMEDKT